MTTQASPVSAGSEDIVARAGKYYRNTRYLMAVLLVGAGAWFAYDGWVGWPEHNRKLAEVRREVDEAERLGNRDAAAAAKVKLGGMSKEKSSTDILIQKILAISLPPLGIALLAWALRNSRGEYRLAGETMHAPGHPPVRLTQIVRIDKELWDRKGIAYVEYEAPGQGAGRIKLDDFVYERTPTDQIYQRLEDAMGSAPKEETNFPNAGSKEEAQP